MCNNINIINVCNNEIVILMKMAIINIINVIILMILMVIILLIVIVICNNILMAK